MTMGSMKTGSKEDKSVKIIGGHNPNGSTKVGKVPATMNICSKIPATKQGTMKSYSKLTEGKK